MTVQRVFQLCASSALVVCVFAAKGCLLPFDDYPEGDVCQALVDAGIRQSTAPDPVLRGCDAGPAASAEDGDAGAEVSEMDGQP